MKIWGTIGRAATGLIKITEIGISSHQRRDSFLQTVPVFKIRRFITPMNEKLEIHSRSRMASAKNMDMKSRFHDSVLDSKSEKQMKPRPVLMIRISFAKAVNMYRSASPQSRSNSSKMEIKAWIRK